jgi:hypothetical protein
VILYARECPLSPVNCRIIVQSQDLQATGHRYLHQPRSYYIKSLRMLESDDPDIPPIPPPGTPDLFTSLLTYIRNTPSSLPLDAVVFQSILLCLIAGDKHLILRTPEEDVGLVVKLATFVSTPMWNTCPCGALFLASRHITSIGALGPGAELVPLHWRARFEIIFAYHSSCHGCS